ncbi:transcription factor DIVARICATA-like protein [Tanacetum coccineum]|uniref:Transcription factor DIVARICATA-like protein n=1 Tax=Tanacetum coccineum TaxID=301880 RepID=A0ABQ5F5D2_9ASTR
MARLSLRHTSIVVAAMASVPGGSYTSRALQYKVTLFSALINTPFEHAICCQKGVSVPDFAVINGTIGEAYYDGQAQNQQLLQQSTDIDNYNIKTLPVVEHGQVIALLDIEKCVYDAIASMEQAAEKGKAIAAAAVEGVEKHWGSSVSGSKEIFDHVPVICPITLAYLTHIGFVLGRRDPPQRPPCRSCARRPVEQERKKGVPWNKEEHKLFLLRLKKYGKGEWRNISRNFVVTRIPTQVASHAQKYFIRQLSGGKDKRRASIHRITSVNIQENHTSPGYKRPTPPGLICSSSRQPYQPPKGLWSGERVRGSELPPNEIPVGVEKAKAGFPSECSPVTRERSLSITGARGALRLRNDSRDDVCDSGVLYKDYIRLEGLNLNLNLGMCKSRICNTHEDVLPVELLQRVQSLLPLKDAASTCILSKSWLRAWYTIPNLQFILPEPDEVFSSDEKNEEQ